MTDTSTRTREGGSVTRVRVERPPEGGRCRVEMSHEGPADRPVVRPMLLASDVVGATVSLVPEGALLLAGDDVSIEVAVGPGARLELIEPAGTVAYAMHGGSARWDVTIDVGAAGSLVWAGEPFVVAEGADVLRRTSIALGWSAGLALRETVVLGRHGERPGRLDLRTEVTGSYGRPVLADGLTVGPDTGPLLLGGSRAIGTTLLLGRRLPDAATSDDDVRFELEAEGTMVRRLATDAHRAVPVRAWVESRRLA